MGAPALVAAAAKAKIVRKLIGLAVAAVLALLAMLLGLVLLIVMAIAPASFAAPPEPPGTVTAEGWSNPAVGPIVSQFGPRVRPCPTCSAFHEGTDIGAACNTPIHAAHDGTVTVAGPSGNYGNLVVIDHGGGTVTAYAHIVGGGFRVAAGQLVTAGQVIGLVGQTGAATGCHLHFEVRVDGMKINAVPVLAAGGVTLGVG